MRSRAVIYLALAFSVLSFSCRKDRNDQVPLVNVDVYININEPQFFNLTVVSGWEYVTGGSRGLLVYRNSTDEFTAYDRHVPFNVDEGCRAEVSDNDIIVEDPCSDSQWLITDGSLVAGPAQRPLHTYQTTFANSVLHIYN